MRTTAALLLLSVALSACDNGTTPIGSRNPLAPATVVLTASSGSVLTSAGDSRIVSAIVRNSAGDVIASPTIEWSSSAPNVASISSDASGAATVTAIGDGTAVISARSGSIEATTQVVVRRALASVSLTAPTRILTYGSTTQFVATAFDARHNAIPNVQGFTFASSNTTSARVSATGAVTALFKFPQLPDAIITASLTRDGITASATANVIVTPDDDIDFGSLMLTEYVVPLNPPTAGSGLVTFKRLFDRITFTVLWSSLTGPVTGVHLRGPALWNENGALLVDLGSLDLTPAMDIRQGFITTADLPFKHGQPEFSLDSLSTLLGNENAYVEIRTARFPNGEIRGQVHRLR